MIWLGDILLPSSVFYCSHQNFARRTSPKLLVWSFDSPIRLCRGVQERLEKTYQRSHYSWWLRFLKIDCVYLLKSDCVFWHVKRQMFALWNEKVYFKNLWFRATKKWPMGKFSWWIRILGTAHPIRTSWFFAPVRFLLVPTVCRSYSSGVGWHSDKAPKRGIIIHSHTESFFLFSPQNKNSYSTGTGRRW